MAKAPQYVQDALASQIVGSSGVDNSAQVISAANAESTATILSDQAQRNMGFVAGLGSAIGNIAQSFGYELRYAQQKKRAMEESQQQALNNFEAKRHMRVIEQQLDDARIRMSEDRRENPFGMASDYEASQSKWVKEYMRENNLSANSKDRNLADVAMQVQSKVEDRLAAQFGQVRSDEKTLSKDNLNVAFQDTVSHMVTRRTGGDLNKLQTKLDDLQNMREEGFAHLGKDGIRFMNDAEQKAIRSHFYEVMQNQPSLAEAQLDAILKKDTTDGKTGVKELLDPEEEKKIRNDIKSWRTTIQNEAEAAVRQQDHIAQMGIMETVLAANIDPQDPEYERKTKIARQQLESKLKQELAKPQPYGVAPEDLKANPAKYRSLSVERTLNSQLNAMDAQMTSISNAKKSAAAQNRAAAAAEEGNRIKTSLAQYNSAENIQRRADLQAKFKELATYTKGKKVPPLELLMETREVLQDAQSHGALTTYKQKQNDVANKVGILKEMTGRALNKEGRPSILEHIMQAKAKPAPDDLQLLYNSRKDPVIADNINRTYQNKIKEAIDAYKDDNNGKITDAEVANIETLVLQKLLFNGQIKPDGTER